MSDLQDRLKVVGVALLSATSIFAQAAQPVQAALPNPAEVTAFQEGYKAAGRMIPNGLFNKKPYDDFVRYRGIREVLGINLFGEGEKTIKSGDITCDVKMKSSFIHSSFADITVKCSKGDKGAIPNPLSEAQIETSVQQGRDEQPEVPRGNFRSRTVYGAGV